MIAAWPQMARLAVEWEKAGPLQQGFDLSL